MIVRDNEISKWVLDEITLKNDFAVGIAKLLSDLTSFAQLWLLIMLGIIILNIIKNKKIDVYFIISLIPVFLIWLISDNYIKPEVERIRPYQTYEFSAFATVMEAINYEFDDNFSFPSGHTLVSFSCAYLISKQFKKSAPYMYVLAALIGFSRIILGSHYFSDVLAGACLGFVGGIIGDLLSHKLSPLINEKINKLIFKEKVINNETR